MLSAIIGRFYILWHHLKLFRALRAAYRRNEYCIFYAQSPISGSGMISWQEDFSKSLDIAWEYKFIIPHSQYAQAVLSLLEETKWAVDKDFVKKLLRVSARRAVYYPDFLHFKIELSEQLTAAEMQVLRLVCADKSNAEIERDTGYKIDDGQKPRKSYIAKVQG